MAATEKQRKAALKNLAKAREAKAAKAALRKKQEAEAEAERLERLGQDPDRKPGEAFREAPPFGGLRLDDFIQRRTAEICGRR